MRIFSPQGKKCPLLTTDVTRITYDGILFLFHLSFFQMFF